MNDLFLQCTDLSHSVARYNVVTRLNFVEPVEACMDHMTISTSQNNRMQRIQHCAEGVKDCKRLTYAA